MRMWSRSPVDDRAVYEDILDFIARVLATRGTVGPVEEGLAPIDTRSAAGATWPPDPFSILLDDWRAQLAGC